MTKSQRPVNVWDLMTLHDVKKYQDVRIIYSYYCLVIINTKAKTS